MLQRGNQTEKDRLDRIADESAALYRALSSVLDQETTNRLFPNAWRHLQRIRSGSATKERRHIVLPDPIDDDSTR